MSVSMWIGSVNGSVNGNGSSVNGDTAGTKTKDLLHLLHGSYRKLCHLMTDMDEWGQVVALDLLTRYARRFFRQPRHHGPMGSAEHIDIKTVACRGAPLVVVV